MINGIINIYKEKGFTSFDVVAKLRGIVKQRKIGHTGTLDPDAQGVLPVCLGNATKLCDMLTDKTKEYIAWFELGITTDTQDISGKVLLTRKINCSREDVEKVTTSFQGKQEQIPPMYSALKVNGKKLYQLAREGIEVERKLRPIEIYEIEILNWDYPKIQIRVVCSKGTYIRTICNDIGEKLGCGATMTELERVRSGEFHKKDSLTISQVEELMKKDALDLFILPVDYIFTDLKKIIVKEENLRRVQNGNGLYLDQLENECLMIPKEDEKFRIYDTNDTFLAIYQYSETEKNFKVNKMFYNNSLSNS